MGKYKTDIKQMGKQLEKLEGETQIPFDQICGKFNNLL